MHDGPQLQDTAARQDVLADYAHILERIYDPAAYGPSAASGEDARQFRPEAVDAPAAC